MRKDTKVYKLATALVAGRTLTTNQIAKLVTTSRPDQLIYQLRKGGMNIVSTIIENRNGRQASYQFVAPVATKRRAARGSAK